MSCPAILPAAAACRDEQAEWVFIETETLLRASAR